MLIVHFFIKLYFSQLFKNTLRRVFIHWRFKMHPYKAHRVNVSWVLQLLSSKNDNAVYFPHVKYQLLLEGSSKIYREVGKFCVLVVHVSKITWKQIYNLISRCESWTTLYLRFGFHFPLPDQKAENTMARISAGIVCSSVSGNNFTVSNN